jgi:hypothetical protein
LVVGKVVPEFIPSNRDEVAGGAEVLNLRGVNAQKPLVLRDAYNSVISSSDCLLGWYVHRWKRGSDSVVGYLRSCFLEV